MLSFGDVYDFASESLSLLHTRFLRKVKQQYTHIKDDTDFKLCIALYNDNFIEDMSKLCNIQPYEVEELFLDVCNICDVYDEYEMLPEFSWLWYDDNEFGQSEQQEDNLTNQDDVETDEVCQSKSTTSLCHTSALYHASAFASLCIGVVNTCMLVYLIRHTRKFL